MSTVTVSMIMFRTARFLRISHITVFLALWTALFQDEKFVLCNDQSIQNTTTVRNETISKITEEAMHITGEPMNVSKNINDPDTQSYTTKITTTEHNIYRCLCANTEFDRCNIGSLMNRSEMIDEAGVCNTMRCCAFHPSADSSVPLCNLTDLFNRLVIYVNDDPIHRSASPFNCLTHITHLLNASVVKCNGIDQNLESNATMYIINQSEKIQSIQNIIEDFCDFNISSIIHEDSTPSLNPVETFHVQEGILSTPSAILTYNINEQKSIPNEAYMMSEISEHQLTLSAIIMDTISQIPNYLSTPSTHMTTHFQEHLSIPSTDLASRDHILLPSGHIESQKFTPTAIMKSQFHKDIVTLTATATPRSSITASKLQTHMSTPDATMMSKIHRLISTSITNSTMQIPEHLSTWKINKTSQISKHKMTTSSNLVFPIFDDDLTSPENSSNLCQTSSGCDNISICIDGKCTCSKSYKRLNDSACVPKTVGDVCNTSSDCILTNNSICMNQTCVCSEPYVFKENVCDNRVLGNECNKDIECASVPYSICNGTCICELGYLKLDTDKCQRRALYDVCNTSTDCDTVIPNSECSEGICLCKEGYTHSNDNSNSCFKRKLFFACTQSTDCSSSVNNSKCENDICQCVSGFINESDVMCYRRRLGLDPCFTDRDCHDAVSQSLCMNGTCVCREGMKESEDELACIDKVLGDTCTSDNDCLSAVNRSTCVLGRCMCLFGYIADNNNTTCRRRIISDICNTMQDCNIAVDNSDCRNETCVCSDGYEDVRNRTLCFKSPTAIGEKCHHSLQCRKIEPVAECKDVCSCPDQYYADDEDTSCTPFPSKIGDSCSEDVHCTMMTTNSFCDLDDRCSCRNGYFTDNNQTVCTPYPRTIGGRCLLDAHCHLIPYSLCSGRVCRCTYKYMPSSDRSVCLQRNRVKTPHAQNIWLGALCNINEKNPCPNWNITNQWCTNEDGRVNTRCQCKPGFANEYNAGECQEIQSYFIRINITEELGCNPGEPDEPRCYIYSPFQYIKQYSNNNTRKFRDMKLRLRILGIDNSFNKSSFGQRFVSSKFINMTQIPFGMQVSGLIHLTEDYYDVLNASGLKQSLIGYLNKNDGVLGKSKLKVGRPIKEHILVSDFNECTDWYGQESDCSRLAWCINTPGSFMCSCLSQYEDFSLDTDNKPGRICKPPLEKNWDDVACSDGKCETNWTWMGLSLSLVFILLLGFLGHEIYSKRKDIQNQDPVYVPVKRKPKNNKQQPTQEEEQLLNHDNHNEQEDNKEDPPLYSEVP